MFPQQIVKVLDRMEEEVAHAQFPSHIQLKSLLKSGSSHLRIDAQKETMVIDRLGIVAIRQKDIPLREVVRKWFHILQDPFDLKIMIGTAP